jgi:hypothetical protein
MMIVSAPGGAMADLAESVNRSLDLGSSRLGDQRTLLGTSETVAGETPACWAMSLTEARNPVSPDPDVAIGSL